MKVLGKQVYRFDGVEVDPSQGCLRRDGEELPVRQKSLQALLYLVEQRHRLVTKEELIERVWEGMAVSDDALVQLIKEIRHSLGDDPRQPRFIKTVPKAGYRFIAPVEEFYLDFPAAMEIERHSSVEIEYEEEIAAETQRGGDTATRRWDLIPGVTVPPRRRVVLLTAAAAILLLAGAAATYFLTRTARRSGPLAEVTLPSLPGRKPLAVMYFNNQSGSLDLDWLREGLADMLITNLSRSKRLNVLSRQQLYLLMERGGHNQTEAIRLDDALEIARKTGAEVIVMGSYVRLGEKIRIDVQLHSAENGQPLNSESTVADKPQDILAQVDVLSLKLAAHLGAAPAVEESRTKLEGLMTNNLDAYRYYSLSMEQAQMHQFNESIALLEKALALDPQFAMAHGRIGYVYAVRLGMGEKARPHLATAWQLSDSLNERDKLFIAAWSANANYEPERAITTYRELLARYPLETDAWRGLAWVLAKLDRTEEARQVIRQGLVTDPEAKDLYNALGGVCTRLGRNDEALAAFQRYIQLAPSDPNAWDSLALFHQGLGQYEQAADAYQRALALNPESRVAVTHLGTLYFRQGRYRAAIEQHERHLQFERDETQRARSFQNIAWIRLNQGDLPRATAMNAGINEEVKRSFSGFLWISLVLAHERGNQTAVQKLGEAIFSPAAYNFYNERGTLRIWNYQHGFAALKQGRAEEAINHFRAAVQQPPVEWNYDSFEDCLANAYLELGRFDEAIAEYERILRLNPNYSLAHYHLGQAYEGKGQKEQARTAYERFLQVWKNADEDVPELVSARKALA